tara:strand:- start:3391 stop:3561 length:171 start_codon:yes stop_codon:yes gene_type:complete
MIQEQMMTTAGRTAIGKQNKKLELNTLQLEMSHLDKTRIESSKSSIHKKLTRKYTP